ncbi:MAG: hypothetical protein HYW79_03530 [Parcubacteria group bacterium]|nr:hypothetical protein [Parcubacteria group bacterium]
MEKSFKMVKLLLRLGLAFVFFYVAIFSFLNPNDWIGFFPLFLRDIIAENSLLLFFSIYELALGFWLISGKYSFLSGLVSAATLLGIIVFNLGAFDIVFRDVGLFFAALALMLLSRPNRLPVL